MAATEPARSQVTITLFWSDAEGQAGEWVLLEATAGAVNRTLLKGMNPGERDKAEEAAERVLGRKLND